ncbi:hypothetical protein HN51_037065 [Arachis hypogaea]|nr:low affinity sulfate transporter 3-like [Arachis hypogaea]
MKWIIHEEAAPGNEQHTTLIMMVDLVSIDTSGIASLEELYKSLVSSGKQLAIANPRWQVIKRIGERVFLTVAEAIDCKLDC